MIFFLVFIDVISYNINIHNTIFVQVVKEYYLKNSLEKTKNFYKIQDTLVEVDENILFAWLWPEQFSSKTNIVLDEPFYRMYNKDLGVNDLNIIRRVDTFSEIRGLKKLFGADAPLYVVNKKYEKSMVDPTDDVMLKALYCDSEKYDEFDFELLKKIKDNIGGYGDTHYLMSLLLLNSLNCFDKDILMQEKENVIKDIVAAQNKDDIFSDLFAERVVVLYWAGENNLIKYDWIKKIVKNQEKDGGWSDVENEISDPHATGLSALSIKYFINNGTNMSVWFVKK